MSTDTEAEAATVTVSSPAFGSETHSAAQYLVDAAWKMRNGYTPGGSTVTDAVARLCEDVAAQIDPTARTTYEGRYPAGSDRAHSIDIYELTADMREALPAQYHQPYYDDLGSPASWLCKVCWDADAATVTAWPCTAARLDGVAVAKAAGLEYSR